ncbi:diguanylate cyclase with PAS/PAC sensor [Cyanobacterium stanieri PCC 7202]|uniref:Diguanylate cyclase with PAS/PAC sensor n=1 Tax=Cyanobacterium stanieri (strain ATCC 29140 / PCC 7202) TaxID=292563 RepID=K9YHJ3_CYASC|nr:diguanylate cyclase with PAS/PAC sensor [Cyanobacterium stanieri PCC 7202]
MIDDNPLKHLLSLELSTGKKTFLLEKKFYSVGRSSSNSIIINHRVTSRHHSLIIKATYHRKKENKADTAFWILDGDWQGQKSRNGLFINTEKIDLHKLVPGDIIIFGGIEIRAKYDIVDIRSKELFSVLDKKHITEIPLSTEVNDINHFDQISSNNDYQELKYLGEENNYCNNTIAELIEGIILIDSHHLQIVDCNLSLIKLLGYDTKEEILDLNLEQLFPLDIEILKDDIYLLNNQYSDVSRDSVIKTKENKILSVELKVRFTEKLGQKIICLSVLDLTQQRKLEELLRYQIYHNPVTNLPNYKLFKEHFFSLLANYSALDDGFISLILVKINEWQEIGYNYNYEVSELILKTIGKRFKQLISSKDIVYHWRDDQFAFLLAQNTSDYSEKIKYQILQVAEESFSVNEEQIKVSLSIGEASYPEDGSYDEILLQKADRTLTENYYEYVKEKC